MKRAKRQKEPFGIHGIYDSGGEGDRFTIVFGRIEGTKKRFALCSGVCPEGRSGHAEIEDCRGLGKRITFAELPAAVQSLVKLDV